MSLSQQERKKFRTIAHQLKPVLTLGDAGASDGLLEELEARLEDHELIKVKVHAQSRDDRAALIDELCSQSGAELVQRTGHVALLYRTARERKPHLSNLTRHQG
jgi:RNA-binding protein